MFELHSVFPNFLLLAACFLIRWELTGFLVWVWGVVCLFGWFW